MNLDRVGSGRDLPESILDQIVDFFEHYKDPEPGFTFDVSP